MPIPTSIATNSVSNVRALTLDTLRELGVREAEFASGPIAARSPIDGGVIGRITEHDALGVEAAIGRARDAALRWRDVPAPRRGELVRLLGEELRAQKETLGQLVSIETGKILTEGRGEVREMIDICDFAVGLSRQLYGLMIASERPGHTMRETWHPLGVIGVITAFNFPVAVWSWNAALAFVCGNSVVWKPSEKTPLSGAKRRRDCSRSYLAVEKSERRSRTTDAFRSYRRLDRLAWAARSRHASRSASVACCWSSVATMPLS